MLKLRKVELLGFKSFCEKTQITFSGTGVTCIVGPNGCGKSNIVDAISWVLGEQSHKSLRAERMADCIFNGTQKRPPLGLAEVSLTLVDPELAEAAEKVMNGSEEIAPSVAQETTDAEIAEVAEGAENPEGGKPFQKNRTAKQSPEIKPGEVVIGRRLYRSGQSEYLVNGRVARLRDIQEIFMGTGLGPDSYAIIEQGRIGQILSSKPMDRRAILEEAAGVSKYKTKRRLAEAKLESSRINLSRVNDILVEVEKQLASLKRQASKARRYTELRDEMRGLVRTLLASKARELDAEAERLEAALRDSGEAESEKARALAALETEQGRLGALSYELESEIRRHQNLLGQSALDLDRAENRIGFNRERVREIASRSAQHSGEIRVVEEQATALSGRLADEQQSTERLRRDTLALEQGAQSLAAIVAGLATEEQATEGRLAELRKAMDGFGDELTRLVTEAAQAEQAYLHHDEARTRVAEFAAHLQTQCAALELCARKSAEEFQAAEADALRLSNVVREAQERIAGERRRKTATAERYDLLREELATSRARRGSLEQILNDRSYTAEAVQKLFAANGDGESRGFRAVGVLADYAEVEEKYEGAVEQFLRDELEYVVVETFDHARAGIAMLREEVGGRATFFVDSLRNLKLSSGEAPVPFQSEVGVVSRLDRLVEFRDPLGAAAKQFLPRLRSAYLVETTAVAEQLARENAQYQFLTPDGTCYSGRLVTGGRPGEAGPLAMKRELRAIESEILQRERSAEEAQALLRWLEDEIGNHELALERTSAEFLEAQKFLVAATLQRDHAAADFARLSTQLAQSEAESARLQTEAATACARAEKARREHAQAEQARTTAEVEQSRAAEDLAGLRRQLAEGHDRLASGRTELAAAGERLAGAEMFAARLNEEHSQLQARTAALHEQQDSLARESTELEAQNAALESQRQALMVEKARLAEQAAEREQEWEQARARTVEVDNGLRVTRQQLDELREERGRREVERARNDADRAHLRETCLAELNAHPEDLLAQTPELLGAAELAQSEADYRDMKARIEAMGPVNMMALEEFQECEQRCTFLTRERDDLVQSIEDTRKTIQELDEVSRQKFQQAFEIINRHFHDSFRTLFGGGTGEMRLTEPDSSGDTGIDIVAQPPGKRLQNVLLLSGGEKALTALALLIAVFRFQPSPFCILDEVDAPLDEANVGRFAKMIQEMSAQTQFIIVTHNRRTMEMAPVLYGVTMQEPGVSRLVSVRWDEPQEVPAPQFSAA